MLGGVKVGSGPWKVTWEDVTDDELWQDGYDTGHADGAAGWPNMLDVLGRPLADVIPLRGRKSDAMISERNE